MKEKYSSLNFKFMEGVSKAESATKKSEVLCNGASLSGFTHKTPSVNLKLDT